MAKTKGHPQSQTSRSKISAALKGHIVSDATREKISITNTGIKCKLKDQHICIQCGSPFIRRANKSVRGSGKYCSIECQIVARRKAIKRMCPICNKEFCVWPSKIERDKGTYCSKQCADISKIGKYNQDESKKSITVCEFCGKHFKRYTSQVRGEHAFCSYRCRARWCSGERSPSWRGGLSFEPYCSKFNHDLKERIRSEFGRKCFLCNKTELENGRKLDVHHCDYNKSQGCSGKTWSLIPLCKSCHIKTNGHRHYWFALLKDYWAQKYIDHGINI